MRLMSTKIYDAYKKKDATLKDVGLLFERLSRFREKVWSESVLKINAHYGNQDLSSVDIEGEIKLAIKKGSWDTLNVSCSAVIYLHPRISGYIVQFFGFDRTQKLPVRGLKDWHYQNQCDHPKKVSDQEWNQREKEWDAIYKSTHTPAKAGLTFSIIEINDAWNLARKVYDLRRGHE